MAWTTPITATDNVSWTAAQFNSGVRDNLLETMPGKASAAGNWFAVTGTNAIAQRLISETVVATSETTTSTSYANLATTGPQAATVATGVNCIVFWACTMSNGTANTTCSASVAVTGATTNAANDNRRSMTDGHTAANGARVAGFYKFTTLTAGNNTFTVQYKVSAGTGTFSDRTLLVMPL